MKYKDIFETKSIKKNLPRSKFITRMLRLGERLKLKKQAKVYFTKDMESECGVYLIEKSYSSRSKS